MERKNDTNQVESTNQVLDQMGAKDHGSPSHGFGKASPRIRSPSHSILPGMDKNKFEGLVLKSYASEKNYEELGGLSTQQRMLVHQSSLHSDKGMRAMMALEMEGLGHNPEIMDSFEDFLKTNNYFDYSINNLFEENPNASVGKIRDERLSETSHCGPDVIHTFESSEKLVQDMPVKNDNITPPDLTTPRGLLGVIRSTIKQKETQNLGEGFKKLKPQPGTMKEGEKGHSVTQTPGVAIFESSKSNQDMNQSNKTIISLGKQSIVGSVPTTPKPLVQPDLVANILSGRSFVLADPSTQNYKQVSEVYADGSSYTGYVLNGKRHGRGLIVLPDGSKYDGDWKDNMMSGIGTLYYQDGTPAYEGGFLDNKIHGHGTMHNKEEPKHRERLVVDYRNFSLVNKEWKTFEGLFASGIKEGMGSWIFSNGDQFLGTFTSDKVNGVGRFLSGNTTIIGVWYNNLFIKKLN